MRDNALPARGAALLLALVAALLLLRQDRVPLLGPDEPRYARVAVEMARSGDLVTPTLRGEPWLEKPVLYYWLAAASIRVFGENAPAARLPSLLATLLLVGGTALVGARLYGRSAGLHAGFAAGTSVLVFLYGRVATMDALLAALVILSTGLGGLAALGLAGRLAARAAWALSGFAVLAKGPIGVVLPMLVLGAFVAATRDRRALRRLLDPWGVLAFLAVVLPWHALILHEQGWAFVRTFLIDHNLRRYTSTIHNHPGPPWYYLPVLLAGLFPWSGLLAPGLAMARPRVSRIDLLVVLWAGLPLVLLSLAGSKLPGYILPCVAPLALLGGRAADALVQGTRAPGVSARVAGLVTVATGAVAAAMPLSLRAEGDPTWPVLLPAAAWTLLLALAFSRRVATAPEAALRVLRVGAAGLLVLLTAAAPTVVTAQHSGRVLFLPARGREVVAWGAWRTNWMAGYFYNDGRVVWRDTLAEVRADRPSLVLCGPEECDELQGLTGLVTLELARGPRGDRLLNVRWGPR